MKAIVFHGIGDIRVDDVPEPRIQEPTDAIVRLTASAICGTDLHMIRGTVPGMKPGRILGHEGAGTVEQVGSAVTNFVPGDRVLLLSTVACGYCSYCRAGYHSQCDHANPKGKGTAFFGGPESAGGFDGMQAEFVRVPFASVGMLKLPEEIDDEQAILSSDIFPTGYFGADIAQIPPGHKVAVFGCGPVGAISSAMHMGAGPVIAVDTIAGRIEMARDQGAETIDFTSADPVERIQELTVGIGVDRAIDAAGIDAMAPHGGPRAEKEAGELDERLDEVREIAPDAHPQGGNWVPGDAAFEALEWAVSALAKAGEMGIIGVYPETGKRFPIGKAMMKNLSLPMGNCNHRKYAPKLIELVRAGALDPTRILSQIEPLTDAIDAYKSFDERRPGWVKVELLAAA